MKRYALFVLLALGLLLGAATAQAADQITYISQPKEVYIFLNNVAYARDQITLPPNVKVKVTLPAQVIENTLIVREGGQRVNTFRLRRGDGGVSLEWNSAGSGDVRPVTLEYLLTGLSWTPTYDMTLGDTKAATVDFNFYAQIQNSVFKLEDVKAHLVAGSVDVSGQVNQPAPASVNQAIAGYERDGSQSTANVGAATIQYIYEAGQLSTDTGETLYLNLLQGSFPARRVLLWNAPSDQQVTVIYKVRNESKLPWAAGSVHNYQNNLFIGSDPVETTPVSGEGSITVGRLQDVRVSRGESRSAISGISLYDTQHAVSLKLENFGPDPLDIEVVDNQNPDGEDFTFSQEPRREPGNLLRWTVTVKPGETVKIDYQYKTR
jgi:hypothetical protein